MNPEFVARLDVPGFYILFAVHLLNTDGFDLVLSVVWLREVTRQLILESAELNVGLLDSNETYLHFLFRHDVANVQSHLLLFFLTLPHYHQLAAGNSVVVLFLRRFLSNHPGGDLGVVRHFYLDSLDEDIFIKGVLERSLNRVVLVSV